MRTLDTKGVEGPTRGPLRASPANPAYFADRNGNAVYLTGSHTWNSLQDWGTSNPPPAMDYGRYLEFLADRGHNFFRLYVWEQAAGVPWTSQKMWFRPSPYLRTGPGSALDGEPKFDLRKWNPAYFERLRDRVKRAGARGIYVSVMLFNGWSVDRKWSVMSARKGRTSGNPWEGHPFHRANNINGVDGDLNHDGEGSEVHTLESPAVLDLEKAYVRKVIDTVGDLDNVLWEISNESNGAATAWEYEIVRLVKAEEQRRPQQHPVGMTAEFPGGRNADLVRSPADWISPGSATTEGYAVEPPAAGGPQVVVTDTDHIWGIGGDGDWVWKSFTRGLNPIFMDPYEADLAGVYPIYRAGYDPDPKRTGVPTPEWEGVRRNLGYTHAYARRVNLAAMRPHGELASTGYCLADPGQAYIVYLPPEHGWRDRLLRRLPAGWLPDTVRVKLPSANQKFEFEWFNPADGAIAAAGETAGEERVFRSPVRGRGAVLYIHRIATERSRR